MKKAFTSLRSYLIPLILLVIAFGISFGIFWITHTISVEKNTGVAWNWQFIMLGIGVLYLLAAIVIREYFMGKYRKNTGDYEGKLPRETSDHIWSIAVIPAIGFLYTFVFVGVFIIIVAILQANGISAPFWIQGGI